MIKTINYSGVTHSPHNSTSPDGELSLCLNLVNDNGTLTPLEEPTPLVTLPDGLQALYTHETSTFRHLIAYDSDAKSLIWVDLNTLAFGNMDWGTILSSLNTAPTINHIGNTLIILHKDKPMEYAVWKNGSYTPLGSHPPFIPIQFGLSKNSSISKDFTLTKFSWEGFYSEGQQTLTNGQVPSGSNDLYGYFDRLPQDNTLTQDILAGINEMVANTYNGDNNNGYGRFVFPFLIRYAIRMYDGSLTQHSYPILMIPNTHISAKLTNLNATLSATGGILNSGNGILGFNPCSLFYRFRETPDLANWEDLIQGIDIYISSPFYGYDQAGYVKGWNLTGSSAHLHESQLNLSNANESLNSATPQEETRATPHPHLLLPTKNTILEDIASCSLFYKLHSLSISQIQQVGVNNLLAIKGSKLSSITSQEVMTDDYNSHNNLFASESFVYNSRLNLTGIKEEIIADVPVDCQVAYLDNPNKPAFSAIDISDENGVKYKLRNNQESYINALPRYMFFPNIRASQIRFVIDNATIYLMPLKEHVGLNGSVYFRGFGDGIPETDVALYDTVDSITIEQPNKIYTSDVDNPFTFAPSNINTIGTGRILALCASTQAISQGQFGAFPLYAFTTEGIWALSVNNSGGWSSIQPVSRDVIVEGTQPISIDKAVVFFSEQGLMILEGGVTTCISKNLTSDSIHPIPANLPTGIPTDELSAALTFPKSASLGYDYTHSRIYVFGKYITWVYSLRKGTWSHTYAGNAGDYALNEYPNMLMVRCNDGKPQELLELTPASGYYSFGEFLTRPVKFGSYSLRTIRSLVTRGLAEDVDVTQVLYASFDGESFAPIAGNDSKRISRISGSGYQMHSLFCSVRNFDSHFAITCTDCDVIPKHTNKLR